MTLTVHTERAREIGARLFALFQSKGIYGHRDMPESLPPSEVGRGSRKHLLFLTFTVAIDYMRHAPELWQASRATYEDEKTSWIFSPSKVASALTKTSTGPEDMAKNCHYASRVILFRPYSTLEELQLRRKEHPLNC